MSYPDFLGIGAQKAGTTWLYSALSQNPAIWLPPVKELRYFDDHRRRPAGEFRRRLVSTAPKYRVWRNAVRARLRRQWRDPSLERARWELRYFLGRPDDRWYAALFEPGRGNVTGDVTPAYSALGADGVARVHRLMPDARIVLLVRHPVERAWSEGVMFFRGRAGTAVDEVALDQWRGHFRRRMSRRRSAYLDILRRWTVCYPPEQVFLGFFEDVVFHAERLLEGVCGHLGVDSHRLAERVERRSGSRSTIPTPVARDLAELYLEQLEELADTVPGYPQLWLRSARTLIDDPPGTPKLPYPYWRSPAWGVGGEGQTAALGPRSGVLPAVLARNLAP